MKACVWVWTHIFGYAFTNMITWNSFGPLQCCAGKKGSSVLRFDFLYSGKRTIGCVLDGWPHVEESLVKSSGQGCVSVGWIKISCFLLRDCSTNYCRRWSCKAVATETAHQYERGEKEVGDAQVPATQVWCQTGQRGQGETLISCCERLKHQRKCIFHHYYLVLITYLLHSKFNIAFILSY